MCETKGNLTILCRPHLVWNYLTFLVRHPGLAEFVPNPDLDRCCQRDEVAERFGWDVAEEYENYRYLMGGF